MSKNIASHYNSDLFKTAMGLGVGDNIPTTLNPNGNDNLKPYNDNFRGIKIGNEFLPPIKKPGSRGSSLNTNYGSDIPNHSHNFKILANESRINELESKLLVMEQNQMQLLSQIKSFELKNLVFLEQLN